MLIPEVTADFRPIERIFLQAHVDEIMMMAADAKIFDHLATPASARQVAEKIRCSSLITKRLLDALVEIKLVSHSDALYANTPSANAFLVSTSPTYQLNGLKRLKAHYADYSANLGKLFEKAQGKMDDQQDAQRDKVAENWATRDALEGMGSYALCGTLQESMKFIRGLPGFMEFRTMCDIGGNHGYYSMALLDENPKLEGTVCDLPHVVPVAQKFYEEKGYGARLTAKTADLRTDAPLGENYDLVFASHILYAWAENWADILPKVHTALAPNGWFVTNHVAMPENGDLEGERIFVELLTVLGGFATHHLEKIALEEAFMNAGFINITARISDQTGMLLLAGQKPAE